MKIKYHTGLLPDTEKWDRFVRSHKFSNLFQESSWLRLLETREDLEPYHITLMKDGNITGVFPNFKRSRGWNIWETESLPKGYGGPVFGSYSEKLILNLLAPIEEKNNSVRHTIRVFGPEAVGLSNVLSRLGYRPKLTDCLPVIDLGQGFDTALKKITGANRRDIKRAEKHAIDIDDSPLLDSDLNSFYKLYTEKMNSIGSTATMELDFFKSYCRNLWQ